MVSKENGPIIPRANFLFVQHVKRIMYNIVHEGDSLKLRTLNDMLCCDNMSDN